MANTQQAEFSLALKENKYKGEVYHQLVGSFEKGSETILISINCDASCNIPMYKTKDKGIDFCYVRAVSFRTGAQKEKKRKNVMR